MKLEVVVAHYLATSRGGELAVAVDNLGRPTVRLSAAAMRAPAAELASRIVRLHTLACLRSQRVRRGDGQAGLTEAQVSTYAATINF